MQSLLLQALLSYLEKNPAIIEQLIGQLVQAIVGALAAHNAPKP